MEALSAQRIPLTLGLGGTAILCHLSLRLFPDLGDVFLLVPGYTVLKPWQVATAGFVEDTGASLLLSVMALLCGARLLQPVWGEHEYIRFLVITNVLQGCMTWVGMISLYILFREEHFLFARLGGLSGAVAGLAVALRQRAPGTGGVLQPLLPLAVAPGGVVSGQPEQSEPQSATTLNSLLPHAPVIWLVFAAVILAVTHSGPPDELLFSVNGMFTAWFYLRYRLHPRARAGGKAVPPAMTASGRPGVSTTSGEPAPVAFSSRRGMRCGLASCRSAELYRHAVSCR